MTDEQELARFKEFLNDQRQMSSDELWAKYGEEYLGPKPKPCQYCDRQPGYMHGRFCRNAGTIVK